MSLFPFIRHGEPQPFLMCMANDGQPDNPRAIPMWLEAALAHKSSVLLKGKQKRDYIFVEDVARAVVLAGPGF